MDKCKGNQKWNGETLKELSTLEAFTYTFSFSPQKSENV